MNEKRNQSNKATLLSEKNSPKSNSVDAVVSQVYLQQISTDKEIKYSLFLEDDNEVLSEDTISVNVKNNDDNTDKDNKDNSNDDNDDDSIESLSYAVEILKLSKMSIPLSIGNFARLAMYNIDSIFLGHLGTDELAGVALCMILMEIVTNFVYAPAWSLNGLCSQAIGAGNPQLAGNWFQLAVGLSTIISLPALIVYWYIGDIIAMFDSDEAVIHYARIFSQFAGSWLLLGAINMALRGYLQSIEVVAPLTIVPIITIGCDAILNYVLIYGIHINLYNILTIEWNGLGFIGSPLATLSSVVLQLLLFYFWCFVYKKHHINKNAWPKHWSLKGLFNVTRVKAFSKIMIPNMISDATENWAYQVTVIMCATLPSSNVAALSCMFDFWGVLWSFYSGFGQTTITRIGKEIGKGNIKKAQFYAKVSAITGSIVTGILSSIVLIFSNNIGQLYSKDETVIDIMDNSLQILSIVYFIGSIGWTASNTMESMSKNKERGIVLVVTAWLVYLPIALYLAFDSSNFMNQWFGLYGDDGCPVCMIFWACLLVETLRSGILWAILIYKVNWTHQSMYAMIRSEIKPNIISNKLNLSLQFVQNEMNKEKNGKKNKGNDDDDEASNENNKEKDASIEYVSLHNAESFSTIVEFETINSVSKVSKLSLLDKDELKLSHGLKNSDLLKTTTASQVQVA